MRDFDNEIGPIVPFVWQHITNMLPADANEHSIGAFQIHHKIRKWTRHDQGRLMMDGTNGRTAARASVQVVHVDKLKLASQRARARSPIARP